MNLPYSKLKDAEQKVLNGIKITSIRDDEKNRWKAGNKIHHTLNSRTKQQRQFLVNTCTHVQGIVIDSEAKSVTVYSKPDLDSNFNRFSIDDFVGELWLVEIAQNDGFENIEDFFDFFKGEVKMRKLIHWTDAYKDFPYYELPF